MLNSARNRRALSFRALVVSTSRSPRHVLRRRVSCRTGTLDATDRHRLRPQRRRPAGRHRELTGAQDAKCRATTDAEGRFQLPAAAGVKYVLEASLPGFNAFRQEFELTSASDWDRAITLQVGRLSETVTVSAKREPATQATPGVPQKKPTPIRVGGNIKAPTKVVNVNPAIPASMRTPDAAVSFPSMR